MLNPRERVGLRKKVGVRIFVVSLVWVFLSLAAVASHTCQISIASFNFKNFGYAGQDCKTDSDLERIALVLATYDVVALQEVMKISISAQKGCYKCQSETCHLELFVERIRSLTQEDWRYVCVQTIPWPYGTRYEYYVILYNAARVTYLGLASEQNTCGGPQKPLAELRVRPPMYAYFRAGNFDFVLLNYHAPRNSKNAAEEVQKLEKAFATVRSQVVPGEMDVILVGDFNISKPEEFFPSDIRRLVFGTTTKGGQPFDTILIDMRYTAHEYTGCAGIDWRPIALGVSNHAIVWARFWICLEDDD